VLTTTTAARSAKLCSASIRPLLPSAGALGGADCRVIALDSRPFRGAHHHGEVTSAQLDWLAGNWPPPRPTAPSSRCITRPSRGVLDLAMLVGCATRPALPRCCRVRRAQHHRRPPHFTNSTLPASRSLVARTAAARRISTCGRSTRARDRPKHSTSCVYENTVLHSVVPVARTARSPTWTRRNGPDPRPQRRGVPGSGTLPPPPMCRSPMKSCTLRHANYWSSEATLTRR
jgi:hypothetical protein